MAKIIILLVLFNIATAYFKKRAKAKREAEARHNENKEAEVVQDRVDKRAPETQSKAKEIGKDILSQLAKELGLELPERPQPKPVPRPVAIPAPIETARVAFALRKNRVISEDDDHDRTVADSTPGADLTSAPGIAAVESANAAAYVTRDAGRVTFLSALRADLFDSESLRRAFILKTILDKPLSLQPRSPSLSDAE